MLSNLKTRLLAVVNRMTENVFLRNTTEVQRFNKTDGAPIPQPPDRATRSYTRKLYQMFKSYDRGSGHPKVSGDRYIRMVSNIYGVPFSFCVIWHLEGSLPGRIEHWRKQRRASPKHATRNLPHYAVDREENQTPAPLELFQRNILETSRT